MSQICPICRASIPRHAENLAAPFCSERCRLVDLGNWLGDAYRVPVEAVDDDNNTNGVESAEQETD